MMFKLGEVTLALAEQTLEPLGLRARHYNVMAMVASDPTLSQRDISDLLGLDPNNAGFATQGRFETIPAGLHRDQIRLNVLAVVELCHALAPAMVERRRGGDRAVYGASKAFVLSFSQALSAELRGRGIRVLALCPGPVNTQFFDVLGSDDAAIGQTLSAEEVVEAALDAPSTGRSVLVPGCRNALSARLARLAPQARVLGIAERATRSVIT